MSATATAGVTATPPPTVDRAGPQLPLAYCAAAAEAGARCSIRDVLRRVFFPSVADGGEYGERASKLRDAFDAADLAAAAERADDPATADALAALAAFVDGEPPRREVARRVLARWEAENG